jgi:hypothetical protein
MTAQTDYSVDDIDTTEPQAYFASARVSKQIFENSSIGLLYVGKHTSTHENGLIDIDGAFRTSEWQLAYQLARSYYSDPNRSEGDYAGSAGFTWFRQDWFTGIRGRYVGEKFDVDQVGFIPWRGTGELVALTGPRWYFDEGYIKSILIYGGGFLNYEKVDSFTDRAVLLGYNMQFRNNWGFEINFNTGRAKELDIEFDALEVSLSSWFSVSPAWHLNVWGGYSKTYNFSRDYLSFYSWIGTYFEWNATDILELGTTFETYVEGDPSYQIADITYNARPFFTLTPLNDLSFRVYLDMVYVRSTQQIGQTILGFLFSYNFLPKSWIYFALNEYRQRSPQTDPFGNTVVGPLSVTDRVGVFKVRYLYYF